MVANKKKRRPQPLRPIPPDYPTGTAKLAAEEGQRYYVDIEELGPAGDLPGRMLLGARGIRDRETDQFDPRPGMTASQVYAEVARLNAGLPVTAISQAIGRRPRTVVAGSAAWWVEILTTTEPTRAILRDAINTGRKLSADDVLELMTYHDDTGVDFRASFPTRLPTQQLSLPPRPTLTSPEVTEADARRRQAELSAHEMECWRLQQAAEKADRKLAASVLKQLNRAFGIKPADGRNKHRAAKKRPR